MGNIPMKSGKLSLQTTESCRRISEREVDYSCPLLQSCNLISFGSVVPESSAGTVSEVWILRLSFYSLTIEYQHIAYSLSGIENQCQNFPTHESAYCLHGYKYTDYQYYTLYSFWYYIGLTSLIFIIISNYYIIDIQRNPPPNMFRKFSPYFAGWNAGLQGGFIPYI